MKIIKIGDINRVLYVAKNFDTGLTDIIGKIISPSNVVTNILWNGIDPTIGFCELSNGIYYYDWDSTGKAVGVWIFESESTSKLGKAADSLLLVDEDTLDNTIFEKLDTMVDAIKAAVENSTYGLNALHNELIIIDENVDDIESIITGSSGLPEIKLELDALTTAVAGISNSTKNTWTTATQVLLPSEGTTITRRIYMTIFDSSGHMEDPDLDQIRVQAFDMFGNNLTTHFISGIEPIYMIKDGVGQYHIDFVVTSTDIVQPIRFTHTYNENGLPVIRDGVVSIVDYPPDPIMDKLNIIEDKVDVVDVHTLQIISNVATLDAKVVDMRSVVNTINNNTDTLETNLSILDHKVELMATVVNTINNNTDTIESDISALDAKVVATKLAVDNVKLDTDIIKAGILTLDSRIVDMRAIVDTIDNNTELLGTKIDLTNSNVLNVQSDVHSIESIILSVDSKVTNIKTVVDTININTDTLEVGVEEINTKVDEIVAAQFGGHII